MAYSRAGQPPGGSHAAPPGVLAQITGMPAFEVAVAPGAPQGMPMAGRGSRPDGVVVGDCAWARVVCGTVVYAAEGDVVVGATGAARDTVTAGVVVAGAGALTIGGGMAAAGAGGVAVVVGTGENVSTFAGVSSDRGAERNAITPKIPPIATATMVRPSAVVCSRRRRRRAEIDAPSGAALEASGSVSVTASSTSDFGKTSGGATGSSTSAVGNISGGAGVPPTSAAGGADTAAAAGSVAHASVVSGAVASKAALAPGMKDFRLPLASSALANSRHCVNLSAGAFMSARAKGASK